MIDDDHQPRFKGKTELQKKQKRVYGESPGGKHNFQFIK